MIGQLQADWEGWFQDGRSSGAGDEGLRSGSCWCLNRCLLSVECGANGLLLGDPFPGAIVDFLGSGCHVSEDHRLATWVVDEPVLDVDSESLVECQANGGGILAFRQGHETLELGVVFDE